MRGFNVEVKTTPFFKDDEHKTLLKASGVSEYTLKTIIEKYNGINFEVNITPIEEGETE